MLDLITGPPGAGKSYEAVAYYVVPALAAGRHVVTNLPLNIAAFEQLDPTYADLIHLVHITPDNLKPFSTVADYERFQQMHNAQGLGVYYVIDEAHIAVPAGNKNTPEDVRIWYGMHRHFAADILLLTQSTRKINKEITDMVRNHIQLRKNEVLGALGKGRYRRFLREGVNGPLVGKGNNIKYDKKFYPLYQTHTGKAGKEAGSNEKSIFSHWIFRYAIPACVLLLIWAFSRVDLSVFTGKPSAARPPVSGSAPPASLPRHDAAAAQPSSLAAPALEDYPFKGSTFLISGYVGSGSSIHHFITVRQPDGRVVHTGLDELRAAGYSVGSVTPCYFSLNYRLSDGKFARSYATCGQLKDLPPIYYVDPTRQVAGIGSGGIAAGGLLSGGVRSAAGNVGSAIVPPRYEAQAITPQAVQSVNVQAAATPPLNISVTQ